MMCERRMIRRDCVVCEGYSYFFLSVVISLSYRFLIKEHKRNVLSSVCQRWSRKYFSFAEYDLILLYHPRGSTEIPARIESKRQQRAQSDPYTIPPRHRWQRCAALLVHPAAGGIRCATLISCRREEGGGYSAATLRYLSARRGEVG